MLPIAIFLHSVLDGRGVRRYEERIWNHTPLTFVYNYLSLRGLVADDYRRQANMLGVAWSWMMHLPDEQRVEAALEALETIDHSQLPPNKKHLLMDFVQTYTPLDETQQRNLDELLTDPQRERLMPFRKLWSESVREKAHEAGRLEGRHGLLSDLLVARFPNLKPETVSEQWSRMSMERLNQIPLLLLKANSPHELGRDSD